MTGKRIRKSTRKSDFVYQTNRKISQSKKPPKINGKNKKQKSQNVLKQSISQTVEPMSSTNPEPQAAEHQIPMTQTINQATDHQPVQSDHESNDDHDQNEQEDVESAINKIYTSFNSGAAMSAGIEKFIKKKRSLSLHKQRRKIFPRRKFVVHQPNDTIMADLIFYEGFKRNNDNMRAVLTDWDKKYHIYV